MHEPTRSSKQEQAALVAHPSLHHLAELRDNGGWTFRHYDSEPRVTELTTGVRVWPDGSADALGVRGETDAQAVRTNPLGELVWKCHSTKASAARFPCRYSAACHSPFPHTQKPS